MNEIELQIMESLRANAFSNFNGVALESAGPDRAVMALTIGSDSKNPFGMVHGGLLYTLADDACGVAAHTDGRSYVTQDGTLHFLRNQPAGTIRASARIRHRGASTCLAEVDITGENGALLAAGQFTYFRVDLKRLTEEAQAGEA